MSARKIILGICCLIAVDAGAADIAVPVLEDTGFTKGFELGRELQVSSNCITGYESMCLPKKIKWSADALDNPVWIMATWGSQGSLTDSWGIPSNADYICTSGANTDCELKAKVKSGFLGGDFLARVNAAGMPLRWNGELPVDSIESVLEEGKYVSVASGLEDIDIETDPSVLLYSSVTVPAGGGEISLKANIFNENYFKDRIPVVQPDETTPVYSTPFLYETHTNESGGNANGKFDDEPRGPYVWQDHAVEPAQPHLYLGQGVGLIPVSGMKALPFHAKVKVIQDRLDTCDGDGILPGTIGCINDTFGSAWTTFDFLFWDAANGRSFNVRIPVFDMRNSFGGGYDVKKIEWTDGSGGTAGVFDKHDTIVTINETVYEKSQVYDADGTHGGKNISTYGGMGYDDVAEVGHAMSLHFYDNGTPTFVMPAYKVVPALADIALVPGIDDIDFIPTLDMDSGNRVQRDGLGDIIRDGSGVVVGHPTHSYRSVINGTYYVDTLGGTEFHRSSQNEYSVLSTNPDPSRGTRFAADVGTPDDATDDGYVSELGVVTHVESGWVTFEGDLLPYFQLAARVAHDSAVTKWIENSCTVANGTTCIDPDTVDPDVGNYRINLLQVSSWEANTLSVSELKISDLSFEAVVDEAGDIDGDGLTNAFELQYGFDPTTPTSNGTTPDTTEALADTDHDGISNLDEQAHGRNPLVADYQVSAGMYHTCALDDDGIQCWGLNDEGQTTVPTLNDPVQVSAGGHHTCALDKDALGAQSVVCWGDNTQGQTTVPTLSHPVSVSAGAVGTCALDDNGVTCWGYNYEHQVDGVPTLSSPTQVSAAYHNCALDSAGAHCWGRNYEGQATVPTLTAPRLVAAGGFHSCAIDGNAVECWGANSELQSSLPSAATFTNPQQVALGFLHTCVMDLVAGVTGVDCFTDNDAYGAATVPTLSQPSQLTAGWRHTCVLDEGGVQCWGAGTTNTGIEPHYGQSIVPFLNIYGWTKDTDSDGYTDDIDAYPLNPLLH